MTRVAKCQPYGWNGCPLTPRISYNSYGLVAALDTFYYVFMAGVKPHLPLSPSSRACIDLGSQTNMKTYIWAKLLLVSLSLSQRRQCRSLTASVWETERDTKSVNLTTVMLDGRPQNSRRKWRSLTASVWETERDTKSANLTTVTLDDRPQNSTDLQQRNNCSSSDWLF